VCDHTAMEFHHKCPAEKSFCISQKLNKPISELKLEVDKCCLLCSNCHKLLESLIQHVKFVGMRIGDGPVFYPT
jgi:hypothetical protein